MTKGEGTADDGQRTASAERSLAVFRQQVGTMFQIDQDGVRVPLQLVEAVEGGTGGGFERFSVLFHGPGERPLPQGTYAFHHEILGALAIFIVPVVGSTSERILYEACFSRPVTP